jgi:hypothetical protein
MQRAQHPRPCYVGSPAISGSRGGLWQRREPPRIKKARENSVGSLATNPHEGSQSEYLAQYVFSSFGTAIPVPHQEDTGLDMYCTLLERIGRRSWPFAYYSVQVKSTTAPWIFWQSGISSLDYRASVADLSLYRA